MNDPDTKRLVYVGGGALFVFLIVNQIYDAGFDAGMRAAGRGGYGDGDGFFPFPLLIIGFLAFVWFRRRAKRNGPGSLGPGNGHAHGHAPWQTPRGGFGPGFGGGRPPRFFEEWHRRAHEAAPVPPTRPVDPAAPVDPAPQTRTPEGTPVGTTLV